MHLTCSIVHSQLKQHLTIYRFLEKCLFETYCNSKGNKWCPQE